MKIFRGRTPKIGYFIDIIYYIEKKRFWLLQIFFEPGNLYQKVCRKLTKKSACPLPPQACHRGKWNFFLNFSFFLYIIFWPLFAPGQKGVKIMVYKAKTAVFDKEKCMFWPVFLTVSRRYTLIFHRFWGPQKNSFLKLYEKQQKNTVTPPTPPGVP